VVDNWYSLEWLSWDTFKDFYWESQFYLYFIPLVPVIYLLRWVFHFRFRQKVQISLSVDKFKWSAINLLRFVPNIFQALSIICVLIALARPQRYNQRIEYSAEGIDIMLVLDISQSMLAKDFQPNRLEAAKQVAKEFIKGRFQDRIGLVIFSGEAYSLMPLTTDYNLLYQAIEDIQYNSIQKEGTAIGSALAVMTNRMKESSAKTKVAVLISDGDNTIGNIDPETAAELAYIYNVKVYTISMSKPSQQTTPIISDEVINYPPDEATLRKIATICEGEFFRVSDNKALKNIFQRINSYEKSVIQETRFQDKQDFYTVYLNRAIILLLIWLACKLTFMENILED